MLQIKFDQIKDLPVSCIENEFLFAVFCKKIVNISISTLVIHTSSKQKSFEFLFIFF